MSRKAKDIFLLTVVLILVTSMFAIVIFDAVMSNKKPDSLEIYIDETPLNYEDKDKAGYAFIFSNSITNITKQLGVSSNDQTLQGFISQMLDAMEKARIPAEKLGKIADTITSSSNDIIKFFTASGDITDEKLAETLSKTKMQHIVDFSNSFFETTTLTEDEFSSVLYYYMLANASTSYKQAMFKLGKKDYITFISNTFYLVNTLGEIGQENKSVQSNVLQSVIYELGSNYIDILDKVGLDAIKTVLGFGWEYQGTDSRVDELNILVASMTDKISFLFGIVGYTMKELKSNDIDNLTHFLSLKEGKERNDYLIYIESIISKAVFQGMLNSLKYLDNDITSLVNLVPELKKMIIDSYKLRMTLANEEENEETMGKYENAFDKFVESVIYFSAKDISIEEIAKMSENEHYAILLDKAKNIEAFNVVLDDFAFNVVFIWASNLITGGILNAQ
jgi:hypothetical protein